MGSSTFSRAFSSGIRLKLWKMKPIFLFLILASSLSVSFDTGLPSNKYSPDVGTSIMPRIFMSVVFPEPEGPTAASYSPSSIFRFMFFSI